MIEETILEIILESIIKYLIPICELIGIFVVAVTVVKSFVQYIRNGFKAQKADVKAELLEGLALSLSFKMAAEILKTVIVRDREELIFLGAVIALRAIVALLIHFEMKDVKKEKQEEKEEAKGKKTGSETAGQKQGPEEEQQK